jgi:hypothetical protein
MSKFNDVVKQAELFEKLALYGDRKSFLKSLAQEVPAPQQEDVIQMPAAHITGYAPIDPKVQGLLSKFLVDHNAGIPLSKIDGKLGPETRQALNNFKKYVGKPQMSDSDAFSILNLPGQADKMVAQMKAQPMAPGVQQALRRSNQEQADQKYEEDMAKQHLRPPIT